MKEGSLLLLIGAVDDLGSVGEGEDLLDSGHVSRLRMGYFCLMASLSSFMRVKRGSYILRDWLID